MKLNLQDIPKSLNKAYLKQDLSRNQIDIFKQNLKIFYARVRNAEVKHESEEHFKKIFSDFLSNTYYQNNYEINISGRKDLVIHNGKSSADTIGVIIEAKRPSSIAEMISESKPNTKALQELIHYYFTERNAGNKDLKHLIATNTIDWYIFDAADFERFFYEDKELKRQYDEWDRNSALKSNTPWLYNEIINPFLDSHNLSVPAVHFNLNEYQEVITNSDPGDDDRLIGLYKILSPEHLLKKPFANDSNTLNKEFYNELLHIIGLEERPDKGKKLIARKKEGSRDEASLLENTINGLKLSDKLENLTEGSDSAEEEIFSIALELCITWLNRILFLKLLEGQLIKYHGGDEKYAFLNPKSITDYDELKELFFEVLALKPSERSQSVKRKYGDIPYLNSSLFEKSEYERKYLGINELKDRLKLKLHPHSVLLNKSENQILQEMSTLHYLFEFLAAYNFSSDSSAKIQENNKTIINASVLGLIFEKINGYRDGSYFTPGFITMYMCRETIRRAVVQKFRDEIENTIENFDDVRQYCHRHYKQDEIARLSNVVNSLKICDPAVGSGHFLVSALNEIIAVKSELGLLTDSENLPLEYEISVENDELVIIHNRTNEPFDYTIASDGKPARVQQKTQEALFREKQLIIENCLFGVDINPKSVLICRLRLWIELLKNAYYKAPDFSELETLPNIDINIKCGNSLISRFNLADNYSALPVTVQNNIRHITARYKEQVIIYKATSDKATKHRAEKEIARLKGEFAKIADPTDADYKKLKEKERQLGEMPLLFTREEQEAWKEKTEKLAAEVRELSGAYNEKLRTLYGNAFEWRFEFPEALDDNGNFAGFDVVIGNPPYIRQEEISAIKPYLKQNYKIYNSISDLLTYFVELGYKILKIEGTFQFIISNKFTRTNYGKELRKFLVKNTAITHFIDFSGIAVFDEATVDAAILGYSKLTNNLNNFKYANVLKETFSILNIEESLLNALKNLPQSELNDNTWAFENVEVKKIKRKVELQGIPLEKWDIRFNYGIKTGYNKAFVIDGITRQKLIESDSNSEKMIKPLLRGRDIQRWLPDYQDLWLIYIPKGFTIKSNKAKDFYVCEPMPRYSYMDVEDAWYWLKDVLPAIAHYLIGFKNELEKRQDMGDFWWEQRTCAYLDDFDKPKIIYPNMTKYLPFLIDTNDHYYHNDKSFHIISDQIYWLSSFFNSKLFKYCFKDNFPGLGVEGRELRKVFFDKIPVKQISNEQEKPFVDLVSQILALKKSDKNADVSLIEKEIDFMIYKLYNLTDDEIKIVEENFKLTQQ